MYLFSGPGLGKESDLQPLAAQMVEEGTHATIVKNDLYQFREGRFRPRPWEHMVKGWLDKGVSVDLIAREGSLEDSLVVANLLERYSQFSFYRVDMWGLDEAYQGEEGDPSLSQRLKTYNFTVFQNPSMLWMEGYHPPRSDTMYACEWISPKGIGADPSLSEKYDRHLLLAEIIRAHSSKEETRTFREADKISA